MSSCWWQCSEPDQDPRNRSTDECNLPGFGNSKWQFLSSKVEMPSLMYAEHMLRGH